MITVLFKGYKGGMYCTQSKRVNRTITDEEGFSRAQCLATSERKSSKLMEEVSPRKINGGKHCAAELKQLHM